MIVEEKADVKVARIVGAEKPDMRVRLMRA